MANIDTFKKRIKELIKNLSDGEQGKLEDRLEQVNTLEKMMQFISELDSTLTDKLQVEFTGIPAGDPSEALRQLAQLRQEVADFLEDEQQQKLVNERLAKIQQEQLNIEIAFFQQAQQEVKAEAKTHSAEQLVAQLQSESAVLMNLYKSQKPKPSPAESQPNATEIDETFADRLMKKANSILHRLDNPLKKLAAIFGLKPEPKRVGKQNQDQEEVVYRSPTPFDALKKGPRPYDS